MCIQVLVSGSAFEGTQKNTPREEAGATVQGRGDKGLTKERGCKDAENSLIPEKL